MTQIINKLIQRIFEWSVLKSIDKNLSKKDQYLLVCQEAGSDYRKFNVFKRNPIYKRILEHVTEEQGKEYLNLIKTDKDIYAALERFKINDIYGSPATFNYPGAGNISPTTLRYAKVLLDLKNLFGPLDNLKICEIGVGYGGQCLIINEYFKPASYQLVDLSPVLSLVKRYLENHVIKSCLIYKTMNELAVEDYDLVISNYALTELPRSIQEIYLNKVILKSKRGYISYNEISSPESNSYKIKDFLERIPGSERLEEVPLTHPKNCIIAWGSNK